MTKIVSLKELAAKSHDDRVRKVRRNAPLSDLLEAMKSNGIFNKGKKYPHYLKVLEKLPEIEDGDDAFEYCKKELKLKGDSSSLTKGQAKEILTHYHSALKELEDDMEYLNRLYSSAASKCAKEIEMLDTLLSLTLVEVNKSKK